MYYSFKKQTLHTYMYKTTEHGKRWVTTRVPDSYNFCDYVIDEQDLLKANTFFAILIN